MNSSGILPRGPRVLVKPDAVDEKSSGGIVQFTEQQRVREEMGQIEGTVAAIGDAAWHDKPSPWAAVGDRIVFAKFAGLFLKGNDGAMYRVINDLDVVAIKEKANG